MTEMPEQSTETSGETGVTASPSVTSTMIPQAASPAPVRGSGFGVSHLVIGALGIVLGFALGFGVQFLPKAPSSVAGVVATPTGTVQNADSSSSGTSGPTIQAGPEVSQRVRDLIAQTRHFRGDPNAPITLIEFSDFQCPYCERYDSEVAPQIIEQYVKEGKVRIGFQHMVFLGEGSILAAEASECAGEQSNDAFWDYSERIFKMIAEQGREGVTVENLKGLAREANLHSEEFNACLDANKYKNLVEAETMRAQENGVNSTPTFLVNGRPLVGAQPFDNFSRVFESILE